MFDIFNANREDAQFVEATQTKDAQQSKIGHLSLMRSWSTASMIFCIGSALLLLAFDAHNSGSNLLFLIFFYSISHTTFVHTDLQIKFLKASESRSKQTLQTDN